MVRFYQVPKFEVQHLLEGRACSDLSVNSVVLIRKQQLFEVQGNMVEFEEIWYYSTTIPHSYFSNVFPNIFPNIVPNIF